METRPPDSVAVNGRQVNLQNLASLQKFPQKRRENKMQEIQVGAHLLNSVHLFPSRRSYKDVAWAILFLVVVAATAAFAAFYFKDIDTSLNEDSTFRDNETRNHLKVEDLTAHVGRLVLAGVAGTVGSLVAAFFFMMLAKACAKPLVYVSLFLVPTIYIIVGVVLLATWLPAGCFMLFIGVCYATCVWRWRHRIPFTVEILEMVAEVSNDNPCMVAVSVLGSILSGLWIVLVSSCWLGVELKLRSDTADQHLKANPPIAWIFVLLLVWGGQVVQNACHTSYCGVFGRWYFDKEGWPLTSSIRVALTTSFGSICLGSLTVAVVRTLDFVVRRARSEAMQEGNVVACVLFCVLDCVISCIGDIMEYFNDWVYVQCAIRGTAFCQSVRSTFALMECNGIECIINDLLVDSVVNMGAFLSALVGAVLGVVVAVVGLQPSTGLHVHTDPSGVKSATSENEFWVVACIGALMGFVGGALGGGSAMTIFSSGTKTILTCWAEDPEPLKEEYGDISDAISERIRSHQNN
ncbi:PNS1 [Symbiodinium microadriaticum]|nr:PNS1 [Symbiodinium microadriaticum]CAE7940460.1 PNS1 [Symbiodinium sp. KB8]